MWGCVGCSLDGFLNEFEWVSSVEEMVFELLF